jgi:hypothetical protein
MLPYTYLRRRFVLASDCREAWLHCACNGPCEVYLNGRLAGRGLGPVLTQMPVWNPCDIGPLLQPGENILLVLARAHPDPDRASWFMAEGEIACTDESKITLCSDGAWQALRADAWQILGLGPLVEVYSAESAPWRQGRLREEAWAAAAMVAAPLEAPRPWSPHPVIEEEIWAREVVGFGEIAAAGPLCFEENPGPMEHGKCVHRESLLQPGKTRVLAQIRSPERAIYLVLDFGHIISGFPRLRLRGDESGILDIGFARVWGEIDSGLRYVCTPGLQEWTDVQLRSCRYLVLRLSQCAEPVELDCVSMLERRVEIEDNGTFVASEALEQIWEIGGRTLETCRQETYWLTAGKSTHDWLRAYVLALDDYYLSGDGRTAAATLSSARPPHPAAVEMPQALAYVLFLEAFQRYCGHTIPVPALLPGALQVLDFCKEQHGEEGLLAAAGTTWSFTALNALYAGALDAGGRLCAAAGDKKQGGRYEREFHKVRQALRASWSAERGLFAEETGSTAVNLTQWSNALVLYFGLADGDQQKQIVHQIRDVDVRRVEGLLEAFFLVGGLWRAGARERALNYLEQQWGRLVARQGQTWGEKANSQGAAVSTGPEYYLGSHILGVRPGAPGYQIFEIQPQPAGLSRAQGRVLTPRGAVQVEWDSTVSFAMRVEREEEGETHLWVPRLGRRFPTLKLNGETVWRNDKFYPNPFVQEIVSAEEHVVLVTQGTGPYEVLVD